jgi:hypothetical protein
MELLLQTIVCFPYAPINIEGVGVVNDIARSLPHALKLNFSPQMILEKR